MKNKIIIYSGCGDAKEKIELYNFSRLTHTHNEDGVSYIRIECDGRYYYFKTVETTISEIEIY